MSDYDLDELRKRVSVPSLLAHYGIVNTGKNIPCWWHDDKDPSAQIFEDHIFCYSCRKPFDIFNIVMKKERLGFDAAVEWVVKHWNIIPEKVFRSSSSDYLGPMPIEPVNHWHRCLNLENSGYLEARGLSAETIEVAGLGWRGDKGAYTIPFWDGIPGLSQVEVLQYRLGPQREEARRYWGEKGHNKPSIINRHVINPKLVVILFGTFDSLLAVQDGIPAISSNGAGQFSNPNRAEVIWLRRELARTERIIIVPDNSLPEFEEAHKLADNLFSHNTIEVKYFPRDMQGKDYTDYRIKNNKTPEDFWREVLDMAPIKFVKGPMMTIWPIHDHHINMVAQILARISEGDGQGAYRILKEIVRSDRATYEFAGLLSWSLQRMCDLRFEAVQPVFSGEEWRQVADDFFKCYTYREVAQVIRKWSDEANNRMGGF